VEPFRIPRTEDIVRSLERILGLDKLDEAPLPIFDAPLELRQQIQRKVTEDLHPDLYKAVEYDMLARRYQHVPELVENLIFAYLVKVEYKGDEVLLYDGEYREEKVWSTYFKRVHDPVRLLEYIARFMQLETGETLNPEDIEVIEVLPNIPLHLWRAYAEGKIDMETVKAEIEALPEV